VRHFTLKAFRVSTKILLAISPIIRAPSKDSGDRLNHVGCADYAFHGSGILAPTMNVAAGASATATSEMNHMNTTCHRQPAAFILKGRSHAN
jgi:hypothetical protein